MFRIVIVDPSKERRVCLQKFLGKAGFEAVVEDCVYYTTKIEQATVFLVEMYDERGNPMLNELPPHWRYSYSKIPIILMSASISIRTKTILPEQGIIGTWWRKDEGGILSLFRTLGKNFPKEFEYSMKNSRARPEDRDAINEALNIIDRREAERGVNRQPSETSVARVQAVREALVQGEDDPLDFASGLNIGTDPSCTVLNIFNHPLQTPSKP